MNSLFKINVLLVAVFVLVVVSTAQTHDLNASRITVLVPSEMGAIRMLPVRLEKQGSMSMFYYKASVSTGERVLGLHWMICVTNDKNEVVHKETWWDKGDWDATAEIESKTVFEFDGCATGSLTVILTEVETESRAIRLDTESLEKHLNSLLLRKNIEVVKVLCVNHRRVSRTEEANLLKEALDIVLRSADLKRALSINPETEPLLFLSEGPIWPNPHNLRSVTRGQINQRISNGESVDYFEYRGLETYGSSIKLVLDYHRPKVKVNSYVDEGIRIEFSYSAPAQGQITIIEIKTSHF